MLKVLLLRKHMDTLSAELGSLETAAAGFTAREAELEADIEAAQTEEERSVVTEAVDAFEAERSANETRTAELRSQISDLEAQIAAEESQAAEARSRAPQGPEHNEEREENHIMETRVNFFGMNAMERDAFMARQEIKDFLTRTRELIREKRSVNGAELLVPTELLPLIRERTEANSKLMSRVNYMQVAGHARVPITGDIPEAVWTECAGAFNELEAGFNAMELDAFKLGGLLIVPNCFAEDADINLLQYIVEVLGISMAKASDKAILFGTGFKMPLGIATRLAATSAGAWWDAKQGPFTDLHSTNVLKLNANSSSGAAFFQTLISALAVASSKYSTDEKPTWVMNRKTHMDILAKALAFNANGALVAGVSTMPVIGGEIVEIDEVPDYQIIGGYFKAYLMVGRNGTKLRVSDEVRMIEDQTVVLGSQRMDGAPVKGEAFVIVTYDNSNPVTSADFPADYANMARNILTVTAAAGATGKTVLTVDNKVAAGNALKYKANATTDNIKVGDTVGATTWSTLTSGTTAITAATGTPIAVVELDGNNRVVSVGDVAAVAGT